MLQLSSTNLKKTAADALFIFVCEDDKIHKDPVILALEQTADSIDEFKGEKDQTLIQYQPADLKARRVIFIGLGKQDKLSPESLRAAAGKAVNTAMEKSYGAILLAVPESDLTGIAADAQLKAMLEGAFLANHLFDKYKKEKPKTPLKKIVLWNPAKTGKPQRQLVDQVTAVCGGTLLAREWVNLPSNDKIPEKLAAIILAQAEKAGLETALMDEKTLRQKNFNAVLGVAAGSLNKPCLLTLSYQPRKARKTIVLVGKGVTYDAGGINLKSSAGLENMKMDMAGAAAVAGTLLAVAALKPNFAVKGVIPLVENMPSGTATRPGDVITSYSGRTIEINNTDAEGRLILADAMAWAVEQYKPEILIDLATLTGACVVSLGEKIAGVFSPDEKLAEMIVSAGKNTHERCWPMPLPEDYKDQLKSDVADTSNIGNTRYGGAITAALFLAEFAKPTRWAHIDIAGPAFAKKANAYCTPGGTGFGVRLLCDLLAGL